MEAPLPRLKSFTRCEHHMDKGGVQIRMVTLDGKEASIIRFEIRPGVGSYGAGDGLYEVMFTDGDDVEGFCDMAKVSRIIYQMNVGQEWLTF